MNDLWALSLDFLLTGAFSGEAVERPQLVATVTRGVAVIPVRGVLFREDQAAIRQAVGSALVDPSVRAILLDVDSPGGVVAGTKELADFLAEARSKKLCAAYANGACLSAAFWLASATGRVLAPQTATVGSIGVVSVVRNLSKLNEKWGLSYTTISSGKWKTAGNENTPLTDEERAYLQERITALHGIFKADVARHLNLTADPAAWGEAQILLAQPASTLGLVTDIVRDMDSAITQIAVETHMTKEELLQTAPDVAASLRAEGAAQAEAAHKAATQAAVEKAVEQAMQGVFGVVKAVAGDDIRAKVETVITVCRAARMDTAQIAAVAPMLVTATKAEATAPAAQQLSTEEQTRAAILAGLQAATPQAVTAGAMPAAHPNPLLADAERRARAASTGQRGY